MPLLPAQRSRPPNVQRDSRISTGQPTEHEKLNPHDKLYRHDLPNGGSITVKRVVVSKQAELITNADTATARYNPNEPRTEKTRAAHCALQTRISSRATKTANCGYCGGKPGTSPVWNRED